jgi:hypothetical protein
VLIKPDISCANDTGCCSLLPGVSACAITEAAQNPMSKLLFVVSLTLALLAILRVPGWADDDSCLHRIVSVSVADRNWAPISDLKPEDFRGEFRGKPVKILSVVPDNGPHRIVIVLDASGSIGPQQTGMSGQSNWPVARQMASHLAEIRPRETSFACSFLMIRCENKLIFRKGRRRWLNGSSRLELTLIIRKRT